MSTPSRRTFLKTTAAAVGSAIAAPYIVPSSVFGANAPSNRIHVGFIGTGNQSTIDLPAFLQHDDVQVLAVCDVNTASYGYKTPDQFLGRKPAQEKVNAFYAAKTASGQYQGCDAYNDFREVLGRKDIDAVAIVVPGPLARADDRGGGQGRQGHLLRKAAVADRPPGASDGRRRCASTSGSCRPAATTAPARPTAWPASWSATGGSARSSGSSRRWPRTTRSIPGPGWQPMPVPEGFDYEMWLGPAPQAPYHKDRCLYRFRFILDYSGGQTTNFGAHSNDIAQWGLGTDDTGPVEFEDTGGEWPPAGRAVHHGRPRCTSAPAMPTASNCSARPGRPASARGSKAPRAGCEFGYKGVQTEPAVAEDVPDRAQRDPPARQQSAAAGRRRRGTTSRTTCGTSWTASSPARTRSSRSRSDTARPRSATWATSPCG